MSAFWIAKDAKYVHADNEDSAQADLNLRWPTHMSEGTFSHVAAHFIRFNLLCKIFNQSNNSTMSVFLK